MPHVKEILDLIYSPTEEETEFIKKAYTFAEKVHEGHKRYSGEPYFIHLFETAKNLASLGMRSTTIAAGLLHDTIEDVDVKPEEIEREFGKEVLFLVEGVTKLGQIRYQGLDRHNESLRKLFVAMSQDIRVLIIRLADRLHNISTLEYVPKEKQKRIATETLEIYAPIAYRLGIRRLSRELEDLAFPYVHPKEYQEISNLVKELREKKLGYLEKFHKSLRKTLAKENVPVIRTDYRIKGLYNLYLKYLRKNKDINKIYDILAFRVIVPTVSDCYTVLGIIHGIWRPLPRRIKDYISFEKPNGYRSLHTTIFTGDGAIVEVQIKTEDMYQESEFGIASHISYKEGDSSREGSLSWVQYLLPFKTPHTTQDAPSVEDLEDVPQWIKELVDYQSGARDKHEFIEHLKSDFFEHRIFVFTPRGDVIDLPVGASPIDFAYAIHSDIGNKIFGAKVNGKLVSLNTHLKNGEIVDIQTKQSSKPSEKWLQYAKTTLAQKHIRSFLQKQKTEERS